MKICFLANQLSFRDGWGRYAISLLNQLVNKGVQAFVLLAENSQENFFPQIENCRILPPLFVNRKDKIISLAKNYQSIDDSIQSADIVHSLLEPYGPALYLISKKKPTIITLHGTYAVFPFRKKLTSAVYRGVYKSAEKLVCVSHFTQNEVLKHVNLSNTLVINNGVDYDKFQIDFNNPFPKKEKMILSVGALMPRKGYHISIPAVAKAKEKYSDLKYNIVGNQKNSAYVSYLKKLTSGLNLTKNINFLDNISDNELIKLYHQSDLFLLTPVNIEGSKFEGFGQVYLEANACAKPVVATSGCGAEDAVEDGFNGFLAAQNDIDQISQKIVEILNNPELAFKLGQNGKKKAQLSCWANVADKYLELYRAVLG